MYGVLIRSGSHSQVPDKPKDIVSAFLNAGAMRFLLRLKRVTYLLQQVVDREASGVFGNPQKN